MNGNLPLHGIVINSDVVNSSPGGHTRHADLRQATRAVLSGAIAQAPAAGAWVRDSRGDGEVTVAPATVPAAWVLADFLNEVYAGAAAYNRNKRNDATGDHRLRLRLGIDCGHVMISDDGEPAGGYPLVLAARLQESAVARQAAVAVPAAPVVAVISDELYQLVVPHGDRGLRPAEFRPVAVTVKGREDPVSAWLYVPRFPPPSVGGSVRSPRAPAADRPSEGAAPTSDVAPSPAPKFAIHMTEPEHTVIGDNTVVHHYGGPQSPADRDV